jgi:hypothetical protein
LRTEGGIGDGETRRETGKENGKGDWEGDWEGEIGIQRRDLLMFSDILPVVYEDTFQGIRNIEFNLWTIDEIALL